MSGGPLPIPPPSGRHFSEQPASARADAPSDLSAKLPARPIVHSRESYVLEMYRTLAGKVNFSEERFSRRLLYFCAEQLWNRAASPDCWQAYLQALAGPERVSPRFLRKATDAFADVLTMEAYHRPEPGIAQHPIKMSSERWLRLGLLIRHVCRTNISFDWEHLSTLATGLACQPLETFSDSTLGMLGRTAPWALRTNNAHAFIRAVEIYLEHRPFLSPNEQREAELTVANHAKSMQSSFARFLTAFDIAKIQATRLEAFGVPVAAVIQSIKEAEAHVKRIPSAEKDALCVAKVVQLATETAEYYRAKGFDALPAIKYIFDLLTERDTSQESLLVLQEVLIPEHKRQGLPYTDLLAAFKPLPHDHHSAHTRNAVFAQAIAAGASVAPFIGSEYSQLIINPEHAAAAKAYKNTFLAKHGQEWAFRSDDGLSSTVFSMASILALQGQKVWGTSERIQAFLVDFCDIADFVQLHHPGSILSTSGPLKVLCETAMNLALLGANYFSLHQYNLGVKRVDPSAPPSVETLVKALYRVLFDAATLAYLKPGNDEVRDRAHSILKDEVRIDSLPFPNGRDAAKLDRSTHDPRALKMHDELAAIMRLGFDRSFGFGRRAYDARRPAGQERNMLVQFGLDSAQRVTCFNSSSNEVFPGAGCRISKFHLERIFAADPEQPSDPYHRYKSVWPFAKTEIEDFAHTSVVALRGLMAVIPPPGEKYSIDGVHYSLVIFNDHFHNAVADRAYLCPTFILESKLEGVSLPARRFNGFNQDINDINLQAPSRAALEAACDAAGVHLLNLNWASNFGGLCNSFPPGVGRHYEWEKGRNLHGPLVDKFGHIHKPARLGGYNPIIFEPKLEAAMLEFRELHGRVRDVSQALYNLHFLFDASLAAYHRGDTVTQEQVDAANAADDTYQFLERPEFDKDAEVARRAELQKVQQETAEEAAKRNAGFGEGPVNPHAYRMLEEIYRWHKDAKSKKLPKSECPIFSLQPTLSYWPRVSPVEIDVHDLTLHMAGETAQLPLESDGTGEQERDMWRTFVLPHFRSKLDPCIVPRSYHVSKTE